MSESISSRIPVKGSGAVHSLALRDAIQGLGMPMRAGLHAGEVELRANDIGGIAVHIAARVSALANAGEVLVSRTVVDLVAGSGIQFTEHGIHELKGVPGDWHVYTVGTAPGSGDS